MEKPQVLPPQQCHEEILRLLKRYPFPTDNNGSPLKFDYGTAGFRYKADLLESIMVRVGILAAHRSFLSGENVGIMVTASHNDESYNGVKMADPNGGMMGQDGEDLAVTLANASLEEIQAFLNKIPVGGKTGVVHVGRDTRSHSPHLSSLAIRGVRAAGATVVCHGVVTTPMLHHVVLHSNPRHLPLLIPPRPLGYLELLAHSYHALLATSTRSMPLEPLLVDCACGVGYGPLQQLQEILEKFAFPECRSLVAMNGPGEGPLNEGCGSEHVQKHVCPPKWYNSENTAGNIKYAASLDGDADRIVFFSQSSSDFTLFDGDKMAVLVCDFLQEQVQDLQNALSECGASLPLLKLGVVQTAYANGASTAYLKQVMGDSIVFAKTGVKHVHKAAHEHFDIGVYFEANGHGTVLFSRDFYRAMAQAHEVLEGNNTALQRLCLLPSLINQAVGDALSDLLLVDAILQLKGWDLATWNQLYTDLPSRQCKVAVKDRSVITTNETETRCTSPKNLRAALDEAMKNVPGSRCFVRPSGTENVVRVYAEAPTKQDADSLASKTAQLVYDLCDGVGDVPTFPTSNL